MERRPLQSRTEAVEAAAPAGRGTWRSPLLRVAGPAGWGRWRRSVSALAWLCLAAPPQTPRAAPRGRLPQTRLAGTRGRAWGAAARASGHAGEAQW